MHRTVLVAAIVVSLCGGAAAQHAPQDTTQDAPQNAPQNAPQDSEKVTEPQMPPAQEAEPRNLEDAVKAMIGAWEFSNADHDRICRFNFRSETATGGFKLDIDKNCPYLFPSTGNIAGWSVDNYGNLRLLDATGNSVVELTEVEGGMYDGFTPEEGRYILQTAAAAPMRSADDMVGDWAVRRGNGKPLCLLTLAKSPAGDALALKTNPGCDAFVTRFGPTAWRMDQGALVLLSARGQTWQFEENDTNTWQRVPETAEPVLLVRQ